MFPQLLIKISDYLKIPPGEITKRDTTFIRRHNNQFTTGIINIIFAMLKETKSDKGVLEETDEALIYQWLEYGIVHASRGNNNQAIYEILKELNSILSSKTFLVGHKLTIADIFLYYVLLNIMLSLSSLEKEKFLNVSRWFDNIQEDPTLRPTNVLVDFSTIYLPTTVLVRQ
ncbi:eukaryotic translation elongation factor 1 epsilon-1 [Euwallacea fornicatus]|uniref:eukaryotic translation elongation factor 1 epsilon-1 n=1 Tax=Euwallacea fornicatus TaxID=995702 RepID=UPI00339023A7